jgi:hypothetical protein
MRIPFLLLLLLAAPAAHAQEATAPAAQGPLRAEPLRQSTVEIPALPGERQPAEATARDTRTAVKAEPSGRDFMYQILMTAVSALVTALIWKAVF